MIKVAHLFEHSETESLEMHITRQLLHINTVRQPINH